MEAVNLLGSMHRCNVFPKFIPPNPSEKFKIRTRVPDMVLPPSVKPSRMQVARQ